MGVLGPISPEKEKEKERNEDKSAAPPSDARAAARICVYTRSLAPFPHDNCSPASLLFLSHLPSPSLGEERGGVAFLNPSDFPLIVHGWALCWGG